MSILKIEKSITTGDENSVAQFFYRNTFANIYNKTTEPFKFEVPMYWIDRATYDYYTQDTKGISTNLNNTKTLLFYFTANTFSLSGNTLLKHDIYRVDYESYLDTKEKIENGLTGDTGFSDIQSKLSTPFYTITETASTITSTAHTLYFPNEIKRTNEFKENLLYDKYQYFVNTTYNFEKNRDLTLGDIYVFSAETGDFEIMSASTATTTTLSTENTPHIITATTFSGLSVNGAYFIYFTSPNKPNINVIDGQPSVIGDLDTFTPIFTFNNVEDGDKYKLQVSYDVNNKGFTGNNITEFIFEKEEGDAEYIRTFPAALTPDSDFIYRIGNTKEIENLFDIRYSITNWSDFVQASASSDGIFSLNGTIYYHNISTATTFSAVTIQLELLSAFSNVDLGVDSRYNDEIAEVTSNAINSTVGTIYTSTSAVDGTFSFSQLIGGTYKITATTPDFRTYVSEIVLSENTEISIVFPIVWGDTIKTFGLLANFTFL